MTVIITLAGYTWVALGVWMFILGVAALTGETPAITDGVKVQLAPLYFLSPTLMVLVGGAMTVVGLRAIVSIRKSLKHERLPFYLALLLARSREKLG